MKPGLICHSMMRVYSKTSDRYSLLTVRTPRYTLRGAFCQTDKNAKSVGLLKNVLTARALCATLKLKDMISCFFVGVFSLSKYSQQFSFNMMLFWG